jgi:hypothetical protein
MNAKEKARDLFEKMKKHTECKCYSWDDDNAKNSAIVCVDEILSNSFLEPQLKRHIGSVEPSPIHLEYWFEVKKEIKRI